MHPLDNPIWQALTITHAGFAETCNQARKFPREVSMLGAFSQPTPENYASLTSLVSPDERVGLFLPSLPDLPTPWIVVSAAPILQMICENGNSSSPSGFRSTPQFIRLAHADVPEMLALAKLTKPGPFAARTYEMGDYLGIRNAGILAAMAGERLRLPGYTEISAVCTHPDHLGHGYASALMAELMDRIRSRGEYPFLHVRPKNTRAIQVYERLGFKQRASFYYAVVHHRAEQTAPER